MAQMLASGVPPGSEDVLTHTHPMHAMQQLPTTPAQDAAGPREPRKPRRRSLRRSLPRSLAAARRTLVLVAAATLVAAAALVTVLATRARPQSLTYTELLRALETRRIAELTIEPGTGVRGIFAPARPATDARFEVVYPLTEADVLIERAEKSGAIVRFAAPSNPAARRQSVALALELLLIGGVLYMLLAGLKDRGGALGVGRRVRTSPTTFADVAGTQGAAEELRELVHFLQRPAAFAALGARVPKGVLLIGPPGTGKTLLARAVAGEAGVPFFHLSGSEVTGFIVGLGAHRIRSLFRRARKQGGVVFIDELDSLGGARGRGRSHGEDDRTLNQLLVEMDGFAPSDGVVVIGATNRPEDLDPALRRPGRFDRTLTIGLPTADGREAILRLHAERRYVPLEHPEHLRRLARLTPGASGADLANLLNEAAIAAVRDGAQKLHWRHFEAARDRVLLGRERSGFQAPEEEWRVVAVHEAGHALLGVLFCPEDPLHKVTIEPRGQAMGVAHFAPEDDRHLHSRRYLEAQILKGLGGRAAEELLCGAEQVTGGAESDLVYVNRIARTMVYRLGMGDATGLIVLDEQVGPPSAEAHARMDEDVRALLQRLYDRARATLASHRPALEALAAALLERKTLEGDEVRRLLAVHGVAPAAVPAA
ncbi:MAG: ATP-dependent zinc metalloprotease FtsH [Gemmatimonadetes bacterium]|nr:ATP-dependent zinc metalloprotease FtsH [Gemmatimonadota bacterium]